MMINWQQIDTVILDLDGTLIDLYFDHQFWKQLVPQAYAEKFGVSLTQSHEQITQHYEAVRGQMQWYCLDYWAETLNLPLRDLLQAQGHQVKVRSDVPEFLQRLNAMNKTCILLTDSHPFSLQVKLANTDLADYFDLLLSSHPFGAPKIEQKLWQNLQATHYFDPKRTLFMDDTQKVLDSAKAFGIAYTIGIENPDSTLPDQQFDGHFSIKNYRTLFD